MLERLARIRGAAGGEIDEVVDLPLGLGECFFRPDFSSATERCALASSAFGASIRCATISGRSSYRSMADVNAGREDSAFPFSVPRHSTE